MNVSETIEALSGMTLAEVLHATTDIAVSVVGRIIQVALIWFIGRWLSKRLIKLVKLLMEKHDVTPSVRTFMASFIDVVSLVVILIMIISILGIDTSSFIALFASAGVAIGMALSGTLQNFAGGVIILLFRPFKVGDFIEAQGVAGTVREIQIFNTLVATGDNKVILLPNGPVSTGIINNYSRENVRRVDLVYSISYGDDFEKAKEVLLRIIKEDERILNAPSAPAINLLELAASSIDISVKIWCKQSDYWDVKFDMNKKVYEIFPKEGLNFPYQTFTVNVTKEESAIL
ncbi:MAG: mechanosensitive ion channel [Bacteroidaceae bacterium]|nr:mechanosensitive ion channel [Bacteroidaceae bacterium]